MSQVITTQTEEFSTRLNKVGVCIAMGGDNEIRVVVATRQCRIDCETVIQ